MLCNSLKSKISDFKNTHIFLLSILRNCEGRVQKIHLLIVTAVWVKKNLEPLGWVANRCIITGVIRGHSVCWNCNKNCLLALNRGISDVAVEGECMDDPLLSVGRWWGRTTRRIRSGNRAENGCIFTFDIIGRYTGTIETEFFMQMHERRTP